MSTPSTYLEVHYSTQIHDLAVLEPLHELSFELERPGAPADHDVLAAELALRPCLVNYQLHTVRWLGGTVAWCTTCGEVMADLPPGIARHLELIQQDEARP